MTNRPYPKSDPQTTKSLPAEQAAVDVGDLGEVAETFKGAAQPANGTSLSAWDVEAFRIAFAKDFGENLGVDEATELAASLLRMMRLVYQPITRDEIVDVLMRRQELGISDILKT